jgi:membrane-associated phospholipid phosphatase
MKNCASPWLTVPVESLIHVYNLLLIVYLCAFFSQIQNSAFLLTVHIASAAVYIVFQISRNRYANPLLQTGTVWIPIILLSALHYETGLFNRIIFHDFLDGFAINADKAIFGFPPYLIFREKCPSELMAQLSHFFYASFYILLVAPLTLLYFQERKTAISLESPLEFWTRASRLKEMQFVLMFTMLSCYIIFIIFPVKGPTDYHSTLFPEPRGMVSIMNSLFSNGDLDGGAMPSSHVAGALVVVIYTFKYLRRWFWIALGLFVPLAISTVYNSYHYATDVIAGLIAGWLFCLIGVAVFNTVDSIP